MCIIVETKQRLECEEWINTSLGTRMAKSMTRPVCKSLVSSQRAIYWPRGSLGSETTRYTGQRTFEQFSGWANLEHGQLTWWYPRLIDLDSSMEAQGRTACRDWPSPQPDARSTGVLRQRTGRCYWNRLRYFHVELRISASWDELLGPNWKLGRCEKLPASSTVHSWDTNQRRQKIVC